MIKYTYNNNNGEKVTETSSINNSNGETVTETSFDLPSKQMYVIVVLLCLFVNISWVRSCTISNCLEDPPNNGRLACAARPNMIRPADQVSATCTPENKKNNFNHDTQSAAAQYSPSSFTFSGKNSSPFFGARSLCPHG